MTMPDQLPTQTMKISDVKSRLNRLMNEIYRNQTRIIVEKSGIPVGAIVPLADLRRLDRFAVLDDEARAVLEAMRAPFRGVPPEEIERETERIMNDIREENRRERERERTARSA
jgi:prevent-host-death family protein